MHLDNINFQIIYISIKNKFINNEFNLKNVDPKENYIEYKHFVTLRPETKIFSSG